MQKIPLLLLFVGHVWVDASQAILPVALVKLKALFSLSYFQVGFIMAVLNLTSSVIQPVFGRRCCRRTIWRSPFGPSRPQTRHCGQHVDLSGTCFLDDIEQGRLDLVAGRGFRSGASGIFCGYDRGGPGAHAAIPGAGLGSDSGARVRYRWAGDRIFEVSGR